MLCRSSLGRASARRSPGPARPSRGGPPACPRGRRYTSLVPTQLRRYLDAEPDGPCALRRGPRRRRRTDPALLARGPGAGIAVVTTYGMTETAGGCVYDGEPLDGVRVRVTDGGVELRPARAALGYRLDPAPTAEAFVDGWFRTRDAGVLADGRLDRDRPAGRRRHHRRA